MIISLLICLLLRMRLFRYIKRFLVEKEMMSGFMIQITFWILQEEKVLTYGSKLLNPGVKLVTGMIFIGCFFKVLTQHLTQREIYGLVIGGEVVEQNISMLLV